MRSRSRRFWSRSSRGAGAGVPVLGLAVALLLAAAGSGWSPVAAQSVFRDDCAPCHGAAGEGGIGPQLAGRALTAQAVTARVRQGGLVMPAFSPQQISDAQLQALIAYVNGLALPPARSLLPAPSAQAVGAPLFQARCLACHGAEARGGIGPGILNTSLPLPRFLQQVRKGGGMMPPFAAAQLSDAQARAIYGYLHPPLARPDPGVVDPLPAVPNYLADFFFALAVLALVGQASSERRRRLRVRVRAEEEVVRVQLPAGGGVAVRVQVF